ncbi:TPA: hypothetical protein ACS3GI_000191 [Serratia marcescens]
MNQTKENFLNKIACKETRAYAEKLYDLELEHKEMTRHQDKVADRVLETVDYYEVIDGKELARLGIEFIAVETE